MPIVTPTNLSLLDDKDRCQHKSIPQLDGPQDGSSSEESEESSDSDADDLEDEGVRNSYLSFLLFLSLSLWPLFAAKHASVP